MKKVPLSPELLRIFRKKSQTLIFEGYCQFFDGVVVYNDGDSYALTVLNRKGDTECCIYSDEPAFIDELLLTFNGKVKFCGVSPFVTAYLQSKYSFNWLTRCDLFVWNGEPLDLSVIDCELRLLDESYAEQVSNGTPYRADVDDVRLCLEKHPSVSAYVDGKAVCWCLLHLEGSLGMLYTVPQYRRQGYALKVMTALTQMVIDRGYTPFAYIIEDNSASKNLALKYNLQNVCPADYFEISFN